MLPSRCTCLFATALLRGAALAQTEPARLDVRPTDAVPNEAVRPTLRGMG